ncbi:hypothetical protein [Phascolarctobacterium sp.]
MALLDKKYNFQKNGEVNVACNIYSTMTEAGSVYIKADSVIGLVPLVGTDDSRASAGRVMKGTNTYAVARTGKPVYTEQRWINPDTYTWTCPGGVTRCRLSLCGGAGFGVGFNIIPGKYGKGGTVGTGNPKTDWQAVSGNRGGYNSGYVNLIPGVTYQINVGAGGIGFGKFGDADWPVYDNGNYGFVLVAFGGDI